MENASQCFLLLFPILGSMDATGPWPLSQFLPTSFYEDIFSLVSHKFAHHKNDLPTLP